MVLSCLFNRGALSASSSSAHLWMQWLDFWQVDSYKAGNGGAWLQPSFLGCGKLQEVGAGLWLSLHRAGFLLLVRNMALSSPSSSFSSANGRWMSCAAAGESCRLTKSYTSYILYQDALSISSLEMSWCNVQGHCVGQCLASTGKPDPLAAQWKLYISLSENEAMYLHLNCRSNLLSGVSARLGGAHL